MNPLWLLCRGTERYDFAVSTSSAECFRRFSLAFSREEREKDRGLKKDFSIRFVQSYVHILHSLGEFSAKIGMAVCDVIFVTLSIYICH